jgi:hypothetical protein
MIHQLSDTVVKNKFYRMWKIGLGKEWTWVVVVHYGCVPYFPHVTFLPSQHQYQTGNAKILFMNEMLDYKRHLVGVEESMLRGGKWLLSFSVYIIIMSAYFGRA